MTHCLLEASTLFWCESVGLGNDWDHIHLQRETETERGGGGGGGGGSIPDS